MIVRGFGSVPTTDLSIAGGKQYTFLYSSWSLESTLQSRLEDLSAYVSNIALIKTGLSTVTVSFIPLYSMPLSAWKTLFEGIGLSDLQDLTVGTFDESSSGAANNIVATLSSPVKNVSTYWTPKIQAAEKSISNTLDSVGSSLKTAGIWIAVFGIGAIGFYAYMKGRGSRPSYRSNPKRRKYGR